MPEPLYFGKSIISLKVVDSTNNYSTELLKQGFVAEGAVIMAEEQTAGRGQRGNTWKSEPGANLTCSIILSPSFLNLSEHFSLSRAISLGVTDALEYVTGFEFLIKWPNDILHEQRKVAGLLIETSSSGGRINNAVAGIGINVNQVSSLEMFNATSLKIISGKEQDLCEVLNAICFFIEKRYLKLKKSGGDVQKHEYLKKLYGLNTYLPFKDIDGYFKGAIRNVDDAGLLEVEKETGEIMKYNLKEISLVTSDL